MATRPAVLLSGMRQAGKSSLLRKLFPSATYITLDDMLIAREATEQPKHFLGRFSNDAQVIIDEIQYAPGLLRELKIIIDENRSTKGKWILTGSQQFSLMETVSESLAGRIAIFELPTLSAEELIGEDIDYSLDELLYRGGFPELWAERELEPNEYFASYFTTYLERDVRSLLSVTDLHSFQRFMQILSLRAANLVNYTELAKDAAISPNTAKSWLSVLEASGVITLIPPWYENMGKRLIKSPKLYFSDSGLLSYLLQIKTGNNIWGRPDIGQIWENFCLSELIKTQPEKPGDGLYFYRDSNGVELDAMIVRDDKVFAFEAKSSEVPNDRKLNFSKVLPLFEVKNYKTKAFVLAPIPQVQVTLAKYVCINPAKIALLSISHIH